ncbi:MAG: MFS transporter [Alphaproteobacteria bacterium]|nr:MFS transporter [Alphaproteobacteria bacterium]
MARYSIWILLLCVGLLCVGHGLHGSLVAVRANAADFGPDVTGLVMSGYAAGLLLSSYVTPHLVRNVGHVRAFAGLASIVSTAVLLMPLWVNAPFWLAMRFISGLCTSGLFIVCESWLNGASSNRNRGQMLSMYMIVTYGALGVGQLLLNVTDTSGFSRFIIVSALLSLSLVPLILLPAEAPSLEGARPVTVDEVWRASPLAVLGAFFCGLAQSAFFAMGAVFGLTKGLPLVYVSLMMALPPIGVILSQYPIGWISDRFDRRTIIMLLSAVSGAVAAATLLTDGFSPEIFIGMVTIFGTLSLPLYSLVIAHANDHLEKQQVLGASAKLVMLYGLGSILGPMFAGQIMGLVGGSGFLIYQAAVYVGLAGFAFWRRLKRPEDLRGKMGEALSISPLTTPAGATTLAEDLAGN